MTNLDQLILSFNNFYNGNPWYGKNFQEIIEDISSSEALAVAGNGQSIAKILLHMNKWRRALSIRLEGNIAFQANEDDLDNWVPNATITAEVWQSAKDEFHVLQRVIIEELGKRKDEWLDQIYIENKPLYTFRYLTTGVLEHDIYHLGQISLMKQLLRSVKPK